MTPAQIAAIIARLDAVDEKLDLLVAEQSSIKAQTTTTNGRVTALEKWQARLTGLVAGAFAVGLIADLGTRLGLLG